MDLGIFLCLLTKFDVTDFNITVLFPNPHWACLNFTDGKQKLIIDFIILAGLSFIIKQIDRIVIFIA